MRFVEGFMLECAEDNVLRRLTHEMYGLGLATCCAKKTRCLSILSFIDRRIEPRYIPSMTRDQRQPPFAPESGTPGKTTDGDTWESQETTLRIERKAVLIQEKTTIIDTSTLLPQSEATLSIDVRALDLGPSTQLPFREGPAIIAPVSATTNAPPPAPFTGTQRLSRDEVERAMAQAALPFAHTPASAGAPAPAPNALTPANLDLPLAVAPDVFATPTNAPGKTIGETFVAGAFLVPSDPIAKPPKLFLAPTISPEVRSDPVILLYLHRPAMARIERKSTWLSIMDAIEEQPIDTDADDPMLSNDPSEILQQTRASAILKQGSITNPEKALLALETAAAKPGRFAPPLDLFEGDLEVLFDEIEAMRARLAMLPASVQQDERAQSVVTQAKRLLESPDTNYALPLLRQVDETLRNALVAGKHITRPDELDGLTARSLLEKRMYQKSAILGGEHLRAQFVSAETTQPLVVYIPAEAALLLPMSVRFRCRMIAEIQFSPDERDAGLFALRCLALGKVMANKQRS